MSKLLLNNNLQPFCLMALSLVHVWESCRHDNQDAEKQTRCWGLFGAEVSTHLFTRGYRALTRERGPQRQEHCYGHRQGCRPLLWEQGKLSTLSVADILLPLVWVLVFVLTVRNIRCHIQGYFLEIEVERALEIIVEKSLEMFLTLNLPSCVLFLTFNISSFPTMGLWARHPLSNTS